MTALNRAAWDEVAADWEKRVNVAVPPAFFRRGGTTLYPLEPALLGPVRGKRLLHIQCGAGEDSVSWAKLGARVTGLDIAERRLEFARWRAREAGLKAEFVRADAMRLPFRAGSFDLAFAARGITCWIPDIFRWFAGIARVLKPGGKFLLVDGHPFTSICDLRKGRRLFVWGDYFRNRPETNRGWWFTVRKRVPKEKAECQWRVADLVNAAVRAGLEIARMEELPGNPGKKGVAGYPPPRWKGRIPHSLVLLCRKPAGRG